jgi:uncharacterized protein (DUF1501 family)
MSLSRRDFMAASALAGGWMMPAFLRRAALAAPAADRPDAMDTVLVVIQLTGGNDGLNTVIPYKHPVYAASRPTLKQAAADIRRIDDELAFHPALGGFSRLLEQQQLAIVQGVGYPEPNRSHFTSLDIWHKAARDPEQEPLGWIGRTAPMLGQNRGAIYVGGGETPLALFGATGYAPSLESLDEYRLRVAASGDDPQKRAAVEGFARPAAGDAGLLDFVRSSARETYASAARVQQAATQYDTPVIYPDTPLATHLKLVAQFLAADVPERIYYTALDGFDTHAGQGAAHAGLLQTLGDAVAAFHEDLAHHGQQQRVVTMTFSEFGRRVAENGSQGTDHGTAAPMFLIGQRVRAGLIGAHPSLDDLESGDVKFHTDFRSVYAAVLDGWLGVPAGEIVPGEFPQLELFAQPRAPV